MKARILISVIVGFLVLFLIGCSTPRKLAGTTKEAVKVEEKRTYTSNTEVALFIDEYKKTGVEVTYTKTEFYPPGYSDNLQIIEEPIKDNSKPPNEQGAIKSIEQYTVKHITEETETTKLEKTTEEALNEEIDINKTFETEIKEEPAADPYRWRYIFGILTITLIIGTVFIYWAKKNKIFTITGNYLKKLFRI